jgi:hypothetical protein
MNITIEAGDFSRFALILGCYGCAAVTVILYVVAAFNLLTAMLKFGGCA